MSRFGAGFGAFVGAVGGAIAGGIATDRISVSKSGVSYMGRTDDWLAIGAVAGSVIGAVVFAGSSESKEPKQVGTSGVGMYLGGNGAFP